MPSLTFEPTKEQKNRAYPIAIVKDTNKKTSKFHNKFLYLDPSEQSKGLTKVEIPMSCIFNIIPSPDKDKRDVYYNAGASGSGKSWIAKQIAENYIKMYPDRDIFVVSQLEYDETLDNMNLGKKKLIRLDFSDWINTPPDINNFSNSMIIFDDIDAIPNKKIYEAVLNFIDQIAICGRKHSEHQGNVSMMFLSHYLSNYKKTRLILNESNNLVLYPQATSSYQISYLLQNRIGMEKDEVKKLKKLGRWTLIHTQYPQYILSSQYAEILHQD